MSRSLNRIQLIGNLGADPEVRALPSGDTVVTLSVATSTRWQDRAGAEQERTEWHRCIAFDKRANTLAQYTRKGARIYIAGEMRYRSYEDANGITRYSSEVHIDEFIFLDAPPERSDARTPKAKARAAAAAGTRTLEHEFEELPF